MDAKAIAQERKRRRRATLLRILGFLSYVVGVASVFAYPQLSHKTYISENALIPGSATIEYSEKDFTNAGKYSRELYQMYRSTSERKSFVHEGSPIIEYLRKLGIESYIHKYEYFDSMNEKKEKKIGFNIYCISRAPKSQGTESIVLSTTYNSRDEIQIFGSNSSSSLNFVSGFGLGISILKLLQDKKWRAKDILFIASDAKYGHHGIHYWLNHYSTSISSNSPLHFNYTNSESKSSRERMIVEGDTLIRSGNIQAALHLDIEPCSRMEVLSVLAEGANGQLPNLDLVNTVFRIAKKDGFRDHQLSLNTLKSGFKSGGIEGMKEVYNWIDKLNSYTSEITTIIAANIKHLTGLVFPVHPVYIQRKELNTLLSFMLHQAIGIPTDDHGFFNLYHINAITISNKASSGIIGSSELLSMVYFGRAVEGTIRSLNNLIEHLHQSFYYYLLPSPSSYISIGDYMISFGLIMLGFAAKILFGMIEVALASDPNANKLSNKSSNSGLVKSLTIVGSFYVFGIILFAAPFFIQFILNDIMQQFVPLKDIALLWILMTIVLLVILLQVVLPAIQSHFTTNTLQKSMQYSDGEWINIKVFGYVPCLLFISACSLLNFSFCLLVAVVIVPVYSFVEPFYIQKKENNQVDTNSNNNNESVKSSLGKKLRNIIQLLAIIAFSPVSLLAFGAWYIQAYNAPQLSAIESLSRIVAVIIEQYQMYSNLTFPFLSIIYIPFNLLSLRVLFHK